MTPRIRCNTDAFLDRHGALVNCGHQLSILKSAIFLCVTCLLEAGGQHSSGAAQRRKQRRMQSWWRHEQVSIAAAIATALHHSAQRGGGAVRRPTGTEDSGNREGEVDEKHDGLPAQKRPLLEMRPEPLEEVSEPQGGQSRTVTWLSRCFSRLSACRYWGVGRGHRQHSSLFPDGSRAACAEPEGGGGGADGGGGALSQDVRGTSSRVFIVQEEEEEEGEEETSSLSAYSSTRLTSL